MNSICPIHVLAIKKKNPKNRIVSKMIALPKLSLALLLGVVSKAMADAKSSHIHSVIAEQEEVSEVQGLHHGWELKRIM